MGEKGVEKAIFYNFLNFIHSKISKKQVLEVPLSPFPPSLLRVGRKE